MKEWYQSLTVLELCYFYAAVIATVLLVVQVIMMCFSLGDDVDIDGDGEIDADTDTGVSVFTIKSLTAFFALGGWAGLLFAAIWPERLWISAIAALVAGAIGMLGVVLFMKWLVKMQYDGTFHVEKLVGSTATVYVSVPPLRQGKGKVTLTAQGRYVELDAMTDDGERIPVDESVEIVATENDCTIIKRKNSDCA